MAEMYFNDNPCNPLPATQPELQFHFAGTHATGSLQTAHRAGWKVSRVELAPSWDQHGFVYLVTLKGSQPNQQQRLILPKNALVERLLEAYRPELCNRQAISSAA